MNPLIMRARALLRLNLLLPLSAGVLVISIIFLATQRPSAEPEIIQIFEITEELDQCFSEDQGFPRNDFIYCSVDDFTFSDSGYEILATARARTITISSVTEFGFHKY